MLEVGSLDFNLFRLSVEISGVRLRAVEDAQVFIPLELFEAERITLNLAGDSLFTGVIHIQKLNIDNPHLVFRQGVQTPAGKILKEPVLLRLDEFVLNGGSIEYGQTVYDLQVFLSDISAGAFYRPENDSHKAFLQSSKGEVVFGEESIEVRSVRLDFDFNSSIIDLNEAVIISGLLELKTSGWIKEYQTSPKFHLQMDAKAFLDPAADRYLESAASGELTASGSLTGNQEKIDFKGSISGRDIQVSGFPLQVFSVDVTGSREEISATNLILEAAGGRLDGTLKLNLQEQGDSFVSLQWERLDLSVLKPFIEDPWGFLFTGTNGFIESMWTGMDLKNLETEGRIELIPYRSQGVSGLIRAKATGNTVRIFPSHIDAGKTRIDFRGGMDIDQNVHSDFQFRAEDLSQLAALASEFSGQPVLPVSGHVAVTGKIAGTLTDPHVTFQVSSSQLFFEHEEIKRLKIKARFHRQHLWVDDLDVRFTAGKLTGKADFDLNSLSYSADFLGKDFDLSKFKSLDPEKNGLQGRARLEFKGKGTFDQPVFDLHLTAEDIMSSSIFLSAAELRVWADGEILRSSVSIPEGETSLKTQLSLQEPLVLKGEFHTNALDASSFLQPSDARMFADIDSRLSVRASFFVPLKDWKELEFTCNLEKLFFGYRDLRIQNSNPIGIAFQDNRLKVKNFILRAPDLALSIEGSLPLDEDAGGLIRAKGKIALSILKPFIQDLQVQGDLVFDGKVQGNLLAPRLNGQIELSGGAVSSSFIPYDIHTLALSVEIRDNMFKLENLEVGLDEGKISGKGNIPIFRTGKGKETAELHLAFTDIGPGNLADTMELPVDTELDGRLDGKLHLSWKGGEFRDLEGKLEINELEFRLDEFSIRNPRKIRMNAQNGFLVLEDFELAGVNSFIRASGSVDVSGNYELNARMEAGIDTAVLATFFKNIVLGGTAEFDIRALGQVTAPDFEGTGKLKNGFFQLEDYPVLGSDIQGVLKISGTSIILESLVGKLNGGPVSAKGRLDYTDLQSLSGQATIKGEQIQVTYPEGLLAVVDADLSVEGQGSQWGLTGDVKASQGLYSKDLHPGAELWSGIRSRRYRSVSDIPPLMRNFSLDVNVLTVNPVIIKNNLATLELEGNIQVKGTPVVPVLDGFLTNSEIGKILFNNRVFEVETVTLEFNGQDIMDGRLELEAHTQMFHDHDDLDITLSVSGFFNQLEYSLSSFPPRSQAELAALIITGHGSERLRSDAANVVGNQMILFFSSSLTSPLTGRIQNWLKAEEVTLEPINIATEEDPGARFTFRKGLARNVDVVFSMDISNTQLQTWILNYDFQHNLSIQSFYKDDGSYGMSLRHSFYPAALFPRQPGRHVESGRSKVRTFQLAGDLVLPEKTLEKTYGKIKSGALFHYSDLRISIEKLIAAYKQNGYLNVVINPVLHKDRKEDIDITLEVIPGYPAALAFSGTPVSAGLKKKIVRSWNGRLPENIALADTRRRILNGLKNKGYYNAQVEMESIQQEGNTVYSVFIDKGDRYSIKSYSVTGNYSIPEKVIKKTIKSIPVEGKKGPWTLINHFSLVKLRLVDLFAEHGYLSPVLKRPKVTPDHASGTLSLVFEIHDGPQSFVRVVEIQGNQALADDEISAILSLCAGSVFNPLTLIEDQTTLLNFYRERGYQDVVINVETVQETDKEGINLTYIISEGVPHVISRIEIAGNKRISGKLIRKELLIKEGSPVNQSDLIRSQKKLRDLGVFRTVNIRRITDETDGNEVIRIELEEIPALGLGYGLRYNTEEKFEWFGQIDLVNVLGGGRNGLFFYRQNERQEHLRFTLTSPYLFGQRFNTLHSFYYLEEAEGLFVLEETGYIVQQSYRLPFDFSLSCLARFSRIREYAESWGPWPFDVVYFIPELQAFLLRDTRDNKLNAQKGSFFSLSLTSSPEFLKSDMAYVSLFTQYSFYRSLPSGFVWASNFRVGLMDTFDKYVISEKMFFAGGGNSIRGFRWKMAGPLDPFFGDAIGGEAVFIMNHELRFPIYRWLRGVAFYDLGNVYLKLEDVDPFKVRQGVGFGLRLDTPFALLRFDYGWNLFPRGDEPKGVFFFSIGQAF